MITKYGPKGLPQKSSLRTPATSKKPLYIIEILDTSGSMDDTTPVQGEDGIHQIRKIDQLSFGVKKMIGSLKDFQKNNVLYDIYLQIIHLDSYGRAVFPEFRSIQSGFNEIELSAMGCTCLGNSLSTLKNFINQRHMPGYNKPVNVILMSDGRPTDVNGFELDESGYHSIIDDFKLYLRQMDYERNIDLYSIAVGQDADHDMLQYFCGSSERFFTVDESESIADKLDFATRMSLAHHTYISIRTNETEEEPEKLEEIFSTEEPDIQTETKKSYTISFWDCKTTNCGACIQNCPMQAIEYKEGKIHINPILCNGCGICAKTCPYHAITESQDDDILKHYVGL